MKYPPVHAVPCEVCNGFHSMGVYFLLNNPPYFTNLNPSPYSGQGILEGLPGSIHHDVAPFICITNSNRDCSIGYESINMGTKVQLNKVTFLYQGFISRW